MNKRKLAINAAILAVVILGLVLLANLLVNNFNIVELIRRFHGS